MTTGRYFGRFSRIAVLALSFSVLASSVSCSIMFMDPVPMQWTPSENINCSGYLAPVVDSLIAAYFIGVGLAAIIVQSKESIYWIMAGAGYMVPGATFTASSVEGFRWSSRCHVAEDAREAWLTSGPLLQDRIEDQWREDRGLPPLGAEP
jgi:hypothetical protein